MNSAQLIAEAKFSIENTDGSLLPDEDHHWSLKVRHVRALLDEIASLTQRAETAERDAGRVRGSLAPFAEAAEEWDTVDDDPPIGDEQKVWPTFEVGDFRRARLAHTNKEPDCG